jgi:hypothetical protein
MQVSTAYSSTSLSFASQSSEVALSTPSGSPKAASTDRVAISEMALQSLSLSTSGSVAGKGGKEGREVGFSFDLGYHHASFATQSAQLQEGPEGLSLSYAESAAELTSTSMSFTMSQTADSGQAGAKGSLQLNDEVSRIAKEVKPLVKEFLAATGVKGGWGNVNRFLRSVA